MTITRRAVLVSGAASVVLLGGAGFWASGQTAVQAREPWRAAGTGFGDARLDAFAYAILAPNPHNMQPWQVALDEEGLGFTVFADATRLLPETDPPARQITIGFGCFLELCRQAAAEKGYRLDVQAFPEGEPWPSLDERPVARVIMVKSEGVSSDPLFEYALDRRTQRAAFDVNRDVDEPTLQRIKAAAGADVQVHANRNAEQRETLRELTSAAWISEWTHASTRGESVRVTRIGKDEVRAMPWGITLDGPMMGALSASGILTRDSMLAPGEIGYEEGLKSYLSACRSAMAHCWLTTRTNTRLDQLRAGASWVRLQQAAAREGVAFHPLSQALQEFPEMAVHHARVHTLLAAPGHTVQMLVRLGYTSAPGPSPREALEAKILKA
ncbi:MAG: hypothetical protein Cons2KO_02470 [Congregibacter sp.]